MALIGAFAGRAGARAEPCFTLKQQEIRLKQVDLRDATQLDKLGYPRLIPSKVDLGRVVELPHKAIFLENRFVRVILLPEKGRIYSLFDKISGQEQLWTNSVARPLFNQQNTLGWWMVWGGVEFTVPAGEHGTTWALPWSYGIEENSEERKTVKMEVVEPETRLRQTVTVSLFPEDGAVESQISVLNTSTKPVRFSHWVNPMWAPGGRGEITPRTEFIVPTERMQIPDRDFNRWMEPFRDEPWRSNPLRFAENWKSIGDLLTDRMTEGFFAAFSHEANTGMARVFDPEAQPGMDIWTWGHAPPPERQRQYSLVPNAGYVEMWGGNVRAFTADALQTLEPGKTFRTTEWMYSFRNTQGLMAATRDLAANLVLSEGSVEIYLCPVRVQRGVTVSLVENPTGKKMWSSVVDLDPATVLHETVHASKPRAGTLQLTVTRGGEVLLEVKTQ